MSLRDDSFLNDKHLQKALQHAPDSDVAPSDVARKTVLDYADKALKARRESWVARAIKAFNAWQLPRWQLAGMGSLAASLLVIVMVFHENPDDPIQVATAPEAAQTEAAPRAEAKLRQGELARDDLAKNKFEQSPQAAAPVTGNSPAPPVAAAESAAPKLKEKTLDKADAKVIATGKSTKQETEAASQGAAIKAPAEKTIVGSAPEMASTHEAAADNDSARHKESAATGELATPLPATVAAAPAPISEPAPTNSPAASADAESPQTAARAAPINKAAKKMADAGQTEAKLKADLPNAIATAKPAVLTSSSALALALSKQGGQALAIADIQAGKLRILYLSNVAVSGAVDEATGYRKEAVFADAEASSKSLAAEIEAYNQIMREWHLNH